VGAPWLGRGRPEAPLHVRPATIGRGAAAYDDEASQRRWIGEKTGKALPNYGRGGVVGLGFAAASGCERETERWGEQDGVGRFFFLKRGGRGRVRSRVRTDARIEVLNSKVIAPIYS